MRKFIRDIIILGVISGLFWLLGIVFCKNGHMFYDAEDYPNYKYVFKEAKAGKKDNKIIILGDSRMMTFVNPVYFIHSDSAQNLSLPGGSPIEAYYVLKNYIESNRVPKLIIVGFDPGHYEGNQILKQGIPFDVFSKIELNEIAFHLKNDSKSNKDIDDIYSYYYGYLPKYGYRLLNSFFIGNYNKNCRIENEIVKNKGCKNYIQNQNDWWSELSEKEIMNQLLAKSHFLKSKTCDYYFKRLLLMCKRNNIQVIVEQLPEPIDHPIYDKEYWNSFLFYMNSFRNYGNVIIVTDIMKYPDSLFRDVMHANDKGSKKYSLELSKKWNL